MVQIEDDLIGLIVNNQRRLMGKVLEYSNKHEFIKYSSTLQEVWRMTISGLSEAIILTVKTNGFNLRDFNTGDDYSIDPVSSFSRKEAHKQQRNRITMLSCLGLIKYCRQLFVDLINEASFDIKRQNFYNSFINRCFDRFELELIAEWNSNPEFRRNKKNNYHDLDQYGKENEYQAVFNSFFAPAIILDNQNRIINFNQAASKLFTNPTISTQYYLDDNAVGFAPHEIVEKINELIISPDNKASVEVFIETHVGKKIYEVQLNKIINLNGRVKGIVIIFNDLTHYKEKIQSLENVITTTKESDRLKTAFLANMSHEIRTPMNAILGFTEVLLHASHPKKERAEFLQLIRSSSNDLLSIIEDLIDIAKMESKQLKIKIKPCKPYDIILDLQAMFHEVLKRYGKESAVELIVNIKESEKELVIDTDRERLKQVLSNLVNNAAKFTDKGFIEFGYKQTDQSGLLFFVRDSGLGIPSHMKEIIFDRFTQVEMNNRKDFRGAGLGLAISKNIVNLLGGNIWVESEPNKGSEFYFILPVLKTLDIADKKIDVLANSGIHPKIDWSGKTLLIAEDDEMNFLYLNEILRNTKVNIVRANNGLEAINIAESEEHIDCILMDIKMPEINGIEATKYIKGIRPDIPIIAQTAFALDGDKEKCLKAGCNAYITKPVRKEPLFMYLEKYLLAKKTIEMKPTVI